MQSFTTAINSLNRKRVSEEDFIFKSDYLSIINKDGWEIVKEKDMIIVLPYLMDEDSILIRLEDVPTYATLKPQIELFPTLISGSIEENETPEIALKRELKEEAGILLKNSIKLDIMQPKHVSKGNIAQYYICILPISSLDYDVVFADGDGSISEKKSKTIKLNIKLFNDVEFFDTISEYVRCLFNIKYIMPAFKI